MAQRSTAQRVTSGSQLPPGAIRSWCRSRLKPRRTGTAGGARLVRFRLAGDVVPGNVARLYARMARDLRDGTRTAPSFEDAVALHRVIVAIEKAAESGSRTVLT